MKRKRSIFFFSLVYPLLFFHYIAAINNNQMTELKEVLIIAGNFSLNGELTNLAQYDIATGV